MSGACVSDLEQWSGISIMSLCGLWSSHSPTYMSDVICGFRLLGSTKIPDAAWEDLCLLAGVCIEKLDLEQTA